MSWSGTLRVLDASSALHAWDNYPAAQFPGLWAWLATELQRHQLAIPSVALEEVQHKAPDCAAWLKAHGVPVLHIGNEVLQTALAIRATIGVEADNYHPKGVDENDVLIIASAKARGAELVTNEGRQFGKQAEARKCKIPAVCEIPAVGVANLNFLEYIKKSQQVF
jgi:hypothetical protein